jgi:hypothetical protein
MSRIPKEITADVVAAEACSMRMVERWRSLEMTYYKRAVSYVISVLAK